MKALTWEKRFYKKLKEVKAAGQRLSYSDPIKFLASTINSNINTRTVNGRFISGKNTLDNKRHKAYVRKKIKQNITHLEIREYVTKNWSKIRKMIHPEVNRIDFDRNYSLDNIEIIERTEHRKKDAALRKTRRTK